MKYCVYFTTYSGQIMPPFYIGSTKVDRILNKNYKGSVSSKVYKDLWRTELRNNPHLFNTEIVSYHGTRKEAYDEEEAYQREEDVINNPLYINECFANGNFCMTGRKHSKETLIKLKRPKTAEHNRKNSEANKGKILSAETKEKIKQKRKLQIITDETKSKISQALIGRKKSVKTRSKMKESWVGNLRNNLPVLCIELNIVFSTCKDAAKYIGLSDSSSIGRCAKGGRKTAGGFTWRFI